MFSGTGMMRGIRRVLGASRVDTHHRITLVKPVLDLFKINTGDLIVFCKDDEGKLCLIVSDISSPINPKRR
jgi:bifunctional DNA-binding transcriptional regulator/antitoxin component of YhaV-PrlF toxin-antitoxin module